MTVSSIPQGGAAVKKRIEYLIGMLLIESFTVGLSKDRLALVYKMYGLNLKPY